MSDADLDRDFQPSTRPQSALALAFANQLNDIFLIDDQLDKLDRNVNRKKQSVSYASSELALLEARIAQTDKLLEEKQASLSSFTQSVPRRVVPDYAVSPGFTSRPVSDEKSPADDNEPKEQSSTSEPQRYQARPPPPPPSVPSTI